MFMLQQALESTGLLHQEEGAGKERIRRNIGGERRWTGARGGFSVDPVLFLLLTCISRFPEKRVPQSVQINTSPTTKVCRFGAVAVRIAV